MDVFLLRKPTLMNVSIQGNPEEFGVPPFNVRKTFYIRDKIRASLNDLRDIICIWMAVDLLGIDQKASRLRSWCR